ncbi:exocyst complex subunit Sec15-like-domain-containing protein [Cokeromyces recurvatus]|uniref:exocyst complex subunit Sec15-like-domain-containing protein n=1 Tax=Cokeromyces recurvatus TaxID=90255 RepID=UPI0022205689|nr:exocyst complex subunit Sec15-like-domain-containing protein [Cokeromyces recurvatus]KAI7904416.1 exocyst complex subunit Sec15-like-domain-containing protein [Cokeromyces recurvatus]
MTSENDDDVGKLAKSLEKVNDPNSFSGLESFSITLDDTENLEQLGPIIKNITETGKQTAFLNALDVLIRKNDGEIERMCNAHYQEFVHAVDQLLKVRQGSVELRKKLTEVNNTLQNGGRKWAEKKRELTNARKVQQNVEDAIEVLQSSLNVLELANKVNEQLEQKKYYSALKTLNGLENDRLGHITQYTFAKILAQGVPVMQNTIKNTVTVELKEWLARIREISRQIGNLAMQRMQERQEKWKMKTSENPKLKNLQHHQVNSAIEMVVNEGLENEINIDFEPLYKCIHVYETLEKRNEFKTSYSEDRRAQANLALSAPINLQDGNLTTFDFLLQDIVGFFIIEHLILHNTTDFRSQAEVDGLWEMVTGKVILVVSESLKGCKDPELFLKIKLSLLIFIQTLEGFDYSVKPLQETLLTLFQRYSELLISQYSEVFEKIVQEDECMPMTVENEEELKEVMQYTRFRPDREFIKRYGFPLRLPFSKVFPTCCRDVSFFVHQFYQFAEGFSQTHGEMDDILKKAVDSLLIQKVNAILLKKLESTNLSQIVQIIINIEYFESTCPDFEMLLMETRSFHRSGHIYLKATSTFTDTRRKAEKRIFELVNSKLDEFLELLEYDWETDEIQRQPSPNLQDLVTFLTNVTNAALLNLPETIKSLLYFDALEHLSQSMKRLLLDTDYRHLTRIALDNFNTDVRFIEDFVNNLGDPTVMDSFVELRQLLNLAILSDNPEEYLTPQIRNKKYNRLNSRDVIVLFEK